MLRDRGRQLRVGQVGQRRLQLRLEACDGAIDAGDLPERPALDAVVSAEALECGCRDAQSLGSTGIWMNVDV